MADPSPVDPYPNKAVIAAIAFLAVIVKSLVQDHDFDWSEEGLTAVIGAVGVVAVYAKSNWRKLTE